LIRLYRQHEAEAPLVAGRVLPASSFLLGDRQGRGFLEHVRLASLVSEGIREDKVPFIRAEAQSAHLHYPGACFACQPLRLF